MEGSSSRKFLQLGRKRHGTRFGHNNNNKQNYNNLNYYRIYKYLWAIAILLSPVKTLANTTVASPQSQSTGVVNNNATMITPSSHPQFRMSQGIVCASPTLTITPYMTDSWSFNRPIEYTTRTPIYDEDTGEIKYYQEIPRFEKDNFNLNYGISAQISVPLGKAPKLCLEATEVNIENQKLLTQKLKMEMELYRLKICGEQVRSGVQFVGKYAVTCEGIQVSIPPNQVIPHTHKIDTKP
tara:strand:- start:672 stop:1388 length:717 start_codon:yes stop_codon:yes gene_type:complete